MEFLVCCVFAYWLVKHTPELVGDAVSEWQHARRGEVSPAVAARRARLDAAGVDPATGGAFRQFASNAWRDMWLELDRNRRERRGDPLDGTRGDPAPVGDRGWWGTLGDRIDDRVAQKADRWRSRTADTDGHPDVPLIDHGSPEDLSDGPPLGDTGDLGDGNRDEDVTDEGSAADEHEGPDLDPGPPVDHDTHPPPREPIWAEATIGEPLHWPAGTTTAVLDRPLAIEGNPMSDVATGGTAVTGVVSGAAEARSIQRHLEAATEQYAAAVMSARNRIHSMGEQTVGVVQMAGKSTVVNACAQAAEAIAAAQAAVNVCRDEVVPLLGTVAREFDKRNS